MCSLMGHTLEELVGKRDRDFVPEDQAEVFVANDRLVLETGVAHENEERLTDGDGDIRTVVTRKRPLVLPNGAKFVIGCVKDISDFVAPRRRWHHAEHDHLPGSPIAPSFSTACRRR